MRLSNLNQELIRKRPQQTKLYLSIFTPQVVMKCRLNNASAAKGDRTIPYDGVTVGSYASIEPNFMMWVGSADGLNDLGKIRVRSATASQFVVSENSNVDWRDNAYLTIFHYVELNPIYPRIINDPDNAEDTIWYKDYDIEHTNQNSILGTYINMGPNRAANLDPASGLASVYYSSTGTYNLLGLSLNYNWTFEGGTPSSSSSANPGLVTYNTAGNYVTKLSVSGTNGAVDTSYRYVRIHSAADPSIRRWELTNLSGSRDEGGYTASFKVYETIPIQEYAIVVLYGENWYGSTKQSLGGNYPNSSDIFWTGYIDKNTIEYDYLHSEMTFDAVSFTQMMKDQSGFSVSVESKSNPSKWYELLDMDGRRALYHYLRWHTTALQCADFQFVGDDYKIQFYDSDRESMYDALDNFMRDTLLGKVVCDRQGKVWMEVGAEAYSNPTGSFPSVFDIGKRDWLGTPSIEQRLSGDISFIEMGGIAYSGVATGTFSALLTATPGNAPGFRGTVETHEGLALLGQDHLNTMAGNVYANRNSPFPTVGLELAGNYANLDIAPQEGVGINIPASDTIFNTNINGLYLPDRMDWNYQSKDLILLPKAEFRQLVNGAGGETIIVPEPEDVEGGFTVPGLQIPPLTPLFPAGASPTGSSCCDALLGYTRACCVTVTKNNFSTSASDGSDCIGLVTIPSYDYTTNVFMYSGGGPKIVFCSGTANRNYTFTLEGDYSDGSNNFDASNIHYASQVVIQLYNGTTNVVIPGIIPLQINAVYRSAGHAIDTVTMTNTNFIGSNYVTLKALGGFCHDKLVLGDGLGYIACGWSNLKLTVCCNTP